MVCKTSRATLLVESDKKGVLPEGAVRVVGNAQRCYACNPVGMRVSVSTAQK